MATLPPLTGTVHLPAGEYVVPQTLPITQPVTVWCDPGVVISRPTLGYLFRAANSGVRWVGATFLCHGAGQGVHVLDRKVPLAEMQNCLDWSFENCTFDGVACYVERVDRTAHNGQQQTAGSDIVAGLQLRSCTFTHTLTPHALCLAGVHDVLVDGCRFIQCGIDANSGDAIKVTAGSHDVRITNNYFQAISRDGIDLFDASMCTLTGNTIRDCGALGIEAKHSLSTYNPTHYHLVAHNRVHDCQSTGISLDADDATCIGNIVMDCLDGYRNADSSGTSTVPCQRGVFLGNRAVRARRNGYYFSGANTLVQGNVALDCLQPALVNGDSISQIGNSWQPIT